MERFALLNFQYTSSDSIDLFSETHYRFMEIYLNRQRLLQMSKWIRWMRSFDDQNSEFPYYFSVPVKIFSCFISCRSWILERIPPTDELGISRLRDMTQERQLSETRGSPSVKALKMRPGQRWGHHNTSLKRWMAPPTRPREWASNSATFLYRRTRKRQIAPVASFRQKQQQETKRETFQKLATILSALQIMVDRSFRRWS